MAFERLKECKVLVVDDEQDFRSLLKDEYIEVGAECMTASSAKEALELLRQHKIDILVTDIRMPEGSGKDLVLSAQKENIDPGAVFFMTGFSDLSVEEALDLGAIAMFRKPFDPSSLLFRSDLALQPLDERWNRQFLRAEVALHIELRLSQGHKLEERALNLGRGGAFVATKEILLPSIGERVSFELSSEKYGPIEGTAVVRWVRRKDSDQGPRGLGIEFESIDSQNRIKLAEIINQQQTKAYIPKS